MSNGYRQGRRRRMDKFSLNEVSSVDRPAQEGALASIAKGGEHPDDMIKRGDLVGLFTEPDDTGHQHGLSLHGDCDGLHIIVHYAAGADEAQMHDHQVMRTPDGRYVMSENRGHTHTINQEAMVNALMAAMNKAEQNDPRWDDVPMELGGVPLADLPEIKKAGEKKGPEQQGDPIMTDKTTEKTADERLAALEAENATLKAIASFTSAQKAHFDTLDAELDDDARKAFIEADSKKRDEIVAAATAKAKDADPVVYTAADGTEYRKSDDARLVKMAKDRDEDRKESIRLRKAAEDADLAKRAEGDLANFPGTVDVRKAILKAVDGIQDEATRKAAIDALKAQNAKLHSALRTIGSDGAPAIEKSNDRQGAEDELDRLAKEAAAKDGTDYYTAYEKVSEANPELLRKAVAG